MPAGIQSGFVNKKRKKVIKPTHNPKCRHVVDRCYSRCYSVPHTFEGCTPSQPKDVILGQPPSSHVKYREEYALATVETSEDADDEPKTMSQPGLTMLSASDLNFMKVQLDMLKEKEMNEAEAAKQDLSSEINNLTDELNNILEQQEETVLDTPAIVSQPDETLQSNDLPDKEIISKQSSLESDDLAVTPQITNPKTISIAPPNDDDEARSSVSSIQNSSSIHKAKVSTTFTSKEETGDQKDLFISLIPEDIPLRAEGKLPDFPDLDSLIDFFDPFMVKVMDMALTFKHDDTMFEVDAIEELADFIFKIASRILAEDQSNKEFLEIIKANVKAVVNIAQQDLHSRTMALATSGWASKKDELMDSHEPQNQQSTFKSSNTTQAPRMFTPAANNNNPSSSDNDSKGARRSNKKRRSDRNKSKKVANRNSPPPPSDGYPSSSDSESDNDSAFSSDSVANDNLYRKILRELMKSAKNYKIKELSMVSDPSQRREKFNNWIIDLRNVLSTHSRTLGTLDNYPSTVPAFTYNVDRAIKALLSSVTVGMAKQIVGNASTASQALSDLKRNYGQTSAFDIHRERLKMMMMKQSTNEKASEFLRRVRRQLRTCSSVGCIEYMDEDSADFNVVNIVLGGLDSNSRLYAATIAELKARYRSNPSSISLIDLEELFFNIDDNVHSSRQSHRREQANYIVGQSSTNKSNITCFRCGKKGHMKKDCKVKLPPGFKLKKDLSKIKCFKCGQYGHYANKCPNASTSNRMANQAKKVTFESAHVAKEGDESCKMCMEVHGNISKFQNNFCFKFQNLRGSSVAPGTNSLCYFPLTVELNKLFKQGNWYENGKEKGEICQFECHRSNIKPSRRSHQKFSSCARASANIIRICEPDIPFSFEHFSASRNDINAKPNFLENRDLRGQFCQAIWVNNEFCENGLHFNFDHLFDLSHFTRFESKTRETSNKTISGKKDDQIAFMTSDKLQRTSRVHLPLGDLSNWLFDSGATSHFTPVLEDIIQPEKLDRALHIKVADGSTLRATHQGMVTLNFTSDQGIEVCLKLLRVLFVPGLQTRLFSIESFVSDGKHQVNYSGNKLQLIFPDEITITIDLPHYPSSTFMAKSISSKDTLSFCNLFQSGEAALMAKVPAPSTEDPIAGGEKSPTWIDNGWEEQQWHLKNKRRMDVEKAHRIFGHRAITSLLWASNANVWDDITLFAGADSWCDSCKIATAPKNPRSKAPMRFRGRPLEYMFVDLVPSPGKMNGVKGYNESQFLFLVDPISKYADKKNMTEKSAEATIEALIEWRREMVKKGFKVFFYLRSDAGTNFTADEFKRWCNEEGISLSIAGPRHQEQNAFAETTYKTVSQMARKMLVHAHLPLDFYHFALDYALLILRVLPPKNLTDEEGNPLTTYQLLHHMKPRVSRFKVFGCPVVFKRYQPFKDGKLVTDFQQIQQGSRGTFVGFPPGQAGWLIYVPEKIQNSHLVVSTDVIFDQDLISLPVGVKKPFAQSQPERNIRVPTNLQSSIEESTGDITTVGPSTITHWSGASTDISTSQSHKSNLSNKNEQVDESTVDSDDESLEDEPVASKEFKVDINAGSQNVDGFRRSSRLVHNFLAQEEERSFESLHSEIAMTSIDEASQTFIDLCASANEEDVPIAPYLPEPKNLQQILRLPVEIREGWIKAIVKEFKFIIDNDTFRRGEEAKEGDEVVPSIIVFKAKITSRGFLDKLKARCVARGDLQHTSDDPDVLWSPCVFARTFKMFVAKAVKHNRPINQLDFIGAFCQALVKERLFLQLPKEYASLMPVEYRHYFQRPQLLAKSIYGLNIAAKAWNEDLTEWLVSNKEIPFIASDVDASLFVHRNKEEFIFLIIYVDDCLYFGSSNELEQKFAKAMSSRFKLETQGWSHWFLGTRLYREEDGSYLLDQENYIRHVLNRYCGKDSKWGLPPMQTTPAPLNYVYTKSNRPSDDKERAEVKSRFQGLSMASAVSSLLYAALNTRVDILWITNKLAKSSTDPGVKDYEALLHVFGYLRAFPDYGIKFYANVVQSPVHQICQRLKIPTTDIVAFTDSSWQDCPDTGRSTTGFKIFVQGGLVDAQSTMPVPVALSSAEAEYMGACNAGAMLSHLRELKYDFEYLGTQAYDLEGTTESIPSIVLVDNQATVRMSKNYKVTGKNRHIGRRWHFVRQGVKNKLFNLVWIPGEDQLADECTKTQAASKSKPHFERTLIKVPEKVKGYKSNVVGNR